MQLSPVLAALVFVLLGGVFVGAWCWLIAAARAAVSAGLLRGPAAAALGDALRPLGVPPHLPLVEWSPRRPVPWGLFDLGMLLALWLALQLALFSIMQAAGWRFGAEDRTLAERQIMILASMAMSLAIPAIGLPLIALRTGATARDFGWSLRDLPRDLWLGIVGLAMLAPPVYALQALLVSVWKPSKHPMVEMFRESPDGLFFVILVLAASIVAPLFEEMMFRVVLQGFLERAFAHEGPLYELIFDRPRVHCLPVAPGALEPIAEGSLEALESPIVAELNPYVSPLAVSEAAPAKSIDTEAAPELRGPAAWAPIGISSLIFALLHWGHGPDWVPLIPLAVGMGYLYQRTHRLVPSLVVHFGLNSLSMWMLWVHVFEGVDAGG
jgi:membrane protease YdiL (CAAX protease family)